MAGIWSAIPVQPLDGSGRPFPGCRAFFYEAATLNPITIYADVGLVVELPNPVQANGDGVFPIVYLDEADEFYRMRVTSSLGAMIWDLPATPIVGPTGGGGGSPAVVDPNGVATTGDVRARLGTGVKTGWVRLNGMTIGSVVSGATERAAADCEALFNLIWNSIPDTICAVVGGRGGTAAADWTAGKQLTLPDARGRTLAFLDDMGNVAAGRITSPQATPSGTQLASSGGAQLKTIDKTNLPAVQLLVTGGTTAVADHQHAYIRTQFAGDANGGSGSADIYSDPTGGHLTGAAGAHSHALSATTKTEAMGTATAFDNMSPFLLLTAYVKL
jgi:hypothetical protein